MDLDGKGAKLCVIKYVIHLKINLRPQIYVYIQKNVLEVVQKKINNLHHVRLGQCGGTIIRVYLRATALVFLEMALK